MKPPGRGRCVRDTGGVRSLISEGGISRKQATASDFWDLLAVEPDGLLVLKKAGHDPVEDGRVAPELGVDLLFERHLKLSRPKFQFDPVRELLVRTSQLNLAAGETELGILFI